MLIVDLGELFPELKDKRVRGRLEGKRVVPYWSRADIDAGRAPLAGKELVWVDDAVEAFFLQIQGSGRVQLAEGGVLRLGYADQNGHPFRSIGRVLVERGELPLDRASMQGIKQWGREHPDALPALLAENPSYVFFRVVAPDPAATIDGPIGTLGVPLAAAADDCRRSCDRTARCAGISGNDLSAFGPAAAAPGPGAGYRRRDQGRVARRFLLGFRRRSRAGGGPHEAGRQDVAVVAEGCASSLLSQRRGSRVSFRVARAPA